MFDVKNLLENLSDTDIARGCRLTRVDFRTALHPFEDLSFREVQEQTLCAEEQTYRIETNTRSLETPHILESVTQTGDFLAPVQRIEEVLEEKMFKGEQIHTLGKYVVCEADTEARRQILGLPEYGPLSMQVDVPGGSPRVAFLSLTESCDGFHKQPMDLQSVCILWRGSPRVWVVVAPRHSETLEAYIASCGTQGVAQCSQFITHKGMIVPPSTLRQWGISFSTFVQNPGDLVWTDHRVYCYCWNMGPNIVEETPWYDIDWWIPPLYRPCQPDMICGKPRICLASPVAEARDHHVTTVMDTKSSNSPKDSSI